MKQLLFLLLFPCLAMAQYQGNGNQKITLGEQTTADGLVWRGIRADTTSKIVPFLDTSAYIILDTVEKTLWLYKAGQIPKWQQVGGSAGGSTIDTASMLTNYYRAGRSGIIQVADIPTLNQNTTGSAATLTTARNIRTNLASAYGANFDGSTDITPGVSGVLGAGNGGTGASNFGSPNRIPFVSSSGSLTTDTFFAYNGTTQRLGVGVPNPTEKLHVSGNGLFTGSMSLGTPLSVANGGTGSATQNFVDLSTNQTVNGLKTFSNIFKSTATVNAVFSAQEPGTAARYYIIRNDAGGMYTGTEGVAGNFLITGIPAYYGVIVARSGLGISANDATEHMRIKSDGEVNIGYGGTDNGAYKLQVNSQILATSSTVATPSDKKYKENITPLTKGLEIVNKLKPVTFNFVNDTENNFSEYEEVGFIAQDVDRALSAESFAKSIVKQTDDSDPNSTYLIGTGNLIPILTKAIQEQQALIKALEQRILTLENK